MYIRPMPNQIKYFLKLSARGFRRGLNQATRAVRSFGTKVKATFSKIGSFITSPIASIATLTIAFYKLFNAMSEGAKRFAELERQFANISTLMDGKLSPSVKNAIKEMSRLYGRDALTIAKSYYDIVSAGITDQTKALDIQNSALKLSVAGYSDVKSTTSALLTVMDAYKDTNLTTAEAIDGMLGVIKVGRTTMDDYAGAVGRVLAVGAKIGVTFKESSAMLAEMTKSGIETTEVVTQMKGIFASLIKTTPLQAKKLRELGIEWSASAVKSQGFLKVLMGVVKATKDLKDMGSLGKIIPRVEALTGFIQFAKKYPEALKNMLDQAGLVDKSLKKVSGTQEEIQKRIKTSIDLLWQDEKYAKFMTFWMKVKYAVSAVLKELTVLPEMISFIASATANWFKSTNLIPTVLRNVFSGLVGVAKLLDKITPGRSLRKSLAKSLSKLGKDTFKFWKGKTTWVDPMSEDEAGEGVATGSKSKAQSKKQSQTQAEQKVVTQYSKLAEVKKKILTLTTEAIQKMTEGIQKIREQTEKAVQQVKNLFFGGSAFEQMAQTRQILEGGEDRRFNFGRLREAGGKAFYTPEQELNFARAIEVLEKNGRDFDEFLRVFKAERGMNPKGQVNAFSVARGFVASPDFAGSIDDRRRQESAEMAERKIREEGRKKEELERQKFILGLNKGLEKIVKSANENLKASDQALNASKLFDEAIGKFEESNKKHEQNISLLSGNYNKILEELGKERKIRIELAEGASDFIQAKMEQSNQNKTQNMRAFGNQQASTGP